MGCHTWFWRKVTHEEFKLIKEYAPTQMFEYCVSDESPGAKNIDIYNDLMRSYNKNLPCSFGKYWWELGWGAGNPKLLELPSNKDLKDFYTFGNKNIGLWVNTEYPEFFRVDNYPRKIVHNKRELRRLMKKKYFELTEEQHKQLTEFWTKYPGGIITFG